MDNLYSAVKERRLGRSNTSGSGTGFDDGWLVSDTGCFLYALLRCFRGWRCLSDVATEGVVGRTPEHRVAIIAVVGGGHAIAVGVRCRHADVVVVAVFLHRHAVPIIVDDTVRVSTRAASGAIASFAAGASTRAASGAIASFAAGASTRAASGAVAIASFAAGAATRAASGSIASFGAGVPIRAASGVFVSTTRGNRHPDTDGDGSDGLPKRSGDHTASR
jgi:hypothetical protein